MVKQTVMRTRPTGGRYDYEYESFRRLDDLLKQGWLIVRCNPIGQDLEYILEKEDN